MPRKQKLPSVFQQIFLRVRKNRWQHNEYLYVWFSTYRGSKIKLSRSRKKRRKRWGYAICFRGHWFFYHTRRSTWFAAYWAARSEINGWNKRADEEAEKRKTWGK